jgi:hypothetical protein
MLNSSENDAGEYSGAQAPTPDRVFSSTPKAVLSTRFSLAVAARSGTNNERGGVGVFSVSLVSTRALPPTIRERGENLS